MTSSLEKKLTHKVLELELKLKDVLKQQEDVDMVDGARTDRKKYDTQRRI